MGYTILSLLVFAISIYLFYITNRKIQAIKEQTISSEIREEMDSLITEFNRTATRNIELLEDRIQEVEKVLQKADKRLGMLDDRIGRANRPIIVEKIVEREAPLPKATPDTVKTVDSKPEKSAAKEPEKVEKSALLETAPETNNEAVPPEKLSRSEQLKALMRQGKTEQELQEMGYQLNEIKLLKFLIK